MSLPILRPRLVELSTEALRAGDDGSVTLPAIELRTLLIEVQRHRKRSKLYRRVERLAALAHRLDGFDGLGEQIARLEITVSETRGVLRQMLRDGEGEAEEETEP